MKTITRGVSALALTGMIFCTTPGAFAFSDVIEGVNFTLGCAGLMLTDPDEHVVVCKPKFPGTPVTLVPETGGGSPVITAPTPPPPPPDDDDCGEVLGSVRPGTTALLVAELRMLLAEVDDCNQAV